MGWGDELMGAGMARGAAARGVRVAFGDGRRIVWTPQAHAIFRGNPNVARPGEERAGAERAGAEGPGEEKAAAPSAPDSEDRRHAPAPSAPDSEDRRHAPALEWVAHYPGRRAYHLTPNREGGRWRYDPAFRPSAGEIFFTPAELEFALRLDPGFVLLEPETKPTGPYKQWGRARWEALARAIDRAGLPVAQFVYGVAGDVMPLPGARPIRTETFRQAAAALARARAAVLPEGGLHHAAAAVGLPAAVIFGGHIHPDTTGYGAHVNLFAGGAACGAWKTDCPHCRAAMEAISVNDVLFALDRLVANEPAAV